MIDLAAHFHKAAKAAQNFNGSRRSYKQFFKSAIAFEEAGGDRPQVDRLLQDAIDSFYRFAGEGFLTKLKRGGTQIFEHASVFVKPDTTPNGITRTGEGDYDGPLFQARLLEVVKILQTNEIYTDDIVLDLGYASTNQMRKKPYHILTISCLNAQIAIADQYGEALFVANPLIELSDWANFEKKQAGVENSPFASIQKIVRKGNWETALMYALNNPVGEARPNNQDSKTTSKQLTEEMILALAFMYFQKSIEQKLPNARSGKVDRDALLVITKDTNWPDENWARINNDLYEGKRGLRPYGGLANFFEARQADLYFFQRGMAVMNDILDEAHGLKPLSLISALERVHPRLTK